MIYKTGVSRPCVYWLRDSGRIYLWQGNYEISGNYVHYDAIEVPRVIPKEVENDETYYQNAEADCDRKER